VEGSGWGLILRYYSILLQGLRKIMKELQSRLPAFGQRYEPRTSGKYIAGVLASRPRISVLERCENTMCRGASPDSVAVKQPLNSYRLFTLTNMFYRLSKMLNE
jgi:hypothetical protein